MVCRCLRLLSVCFNCALIACTCVLLFPSTCWRCYIVATWRGFGICGVMVVLLLEASRKIITYSGCFLFYGKAIGLSMPKGGREQGCLWVSFLVPFVLKFSLLYVLV